MDCLKNDFQAFGATDGSTVDNRLTFGVDRAEWTLLPNSALSSRGRSVIPVVRKRSIVANPACGQFNRENKALLSLFVPETVVSRDRFGRPIMRQLVHSPLPGRL